MSSLFGGGKQPSYTPPAKSADQIAAEEAERQKKIADDNRRTAAGRAAFIAGGEQTDENLNIQRKMLFGQ